MGLGPYPDVTLAQAREFAMQNLALVREGHDPIRHRENIKAENARAYAAFEQLTKQCFGVKRAELKGDGKSSRWLSPLEHHLFPKISKIGIEKLKGHA